MRALALAAALFVMLDDDERRDLREPLTRERTERLASWLEAARETREPR
jgi:hypothetical protein